jgi:hypothetical protein
LALRVKVMLNPRRMLDDAMVSAGVNDKHICKLY